MGVVAQKTFAANGAIAGGAEKSLLASMPSPSDASGKRENRDKGEGGNGATERNTVVMMMRCRVRK